MFYQGTLPENRCDLEVGADEGTLYFGPVHKSCAAKFHQFLEAFDLTTGADSRIKTVPVLVDLARIEVTGEDVCGYFLESDGIEAADETLDAFLLRVCPKNYPVFVGGHYHPDDETRINTVMTAVHDGVSVRWSRLRNRLRDGNSLCISTASDLAVSV